MKNNKLLPTIFVISILTLLIIVGMLFLKNIKEKEQPLYKAYGNSYGINWNGAACENIDYAKSMGYDYVMYQGEMEKCPNAKDLHFYIENPEQRGQMPYWEIRFDKTYTDAQKAEINNMFVWKSNEAFPKNLATGWFFGSGSFRPNLDFQRQEIIDLTVSKSLSFAKSKENKANNFLFGGWAWDVPDLKGDFWTASQSSGGKIVDLSYWNANKIESGYNHGQTYQYSTYSEARAAWMVKLFAETKKEFPDFAVDYEPYGIYSWIKVIQGRADAKLLMPARTLLCQENGDGLANDIMFVTDERIFSSGLIKKDSTCSSTPDTHDHSRNLNIASNAAINGAYFNWFGRFGGSKDDSTGIMSPTYSSVTQVPARLKLIRVIPAWDNMNNVPLSERAYNTTAKIYTSATSYMSENLIYSQKPNSKFIYVVFLTQKEAVKLGAAEKVSGIYNTDGLLRLTTKTEDLKVTGSSVSLINSGGVGKGYIIELS